MDNVGACESELWETTDSEGILCFAKTFLCLISYNTFNSFNWSSFQIPERVLSADETTDVPGDELHKEGESESLSDIDDAEVHSSCLSHGAFICHFLIKIFLLYKRMKI